MIETSKIDPETAIYGYLMGAANDKQGSYKEAIACYQSALTKNPEDRLMREILLLIEDSALKIKDIETHFTAGICLLNFYK